MASSSGSSSAFFALLTLSLLVGCSTQPPTLESTLDPSDQAVSAVVNGEDASPTDYRFMVALYIRTEEPETTLFCGGTLLDGNSVLTAAHCVAPPVFAVPQSIAGVEVLVDTYELVPELEDRDPQKVIPVEEIEIIPTHRRNNILSFYQGQDVAVLQLDPQTPEQVDLLNRLPKVQLTEVNTADRPGLLGTALGWGELSFAGPRPEVLQQVQLSLLTQQQCQRVFPPAPLGEDVLCGSSRPPGSFLPVPAEELLGVCRGDSGGPLLANSEQVGVSSFSLGLPPGCARRIGYSGFVQLGQPQINRFIRLSAASNGFVARL